MVTFIAATPEETENLGRKIGTALSHGAVVSLSGPLGAGKTVLTKGIAQGLGVNSTITSPSFTIVVEHEGNIPLRHIDLYRTGSDEELELFGFTELTSGDGVTVIEWGEKALSFLDDDRVEVIISIRKDGSRELNITGPANILESLGGKA